MPIVPLSFAVPVWGADYVRTYLDVCLPAQLSQGNLGSLEEGDDHSYTIFTTDNDFGVIQASPAFARLKSLVRTQVEFLPTMSDGANKYDVKTRCYRRALEAACGRGAAVFALNADMVLADGFVKKAADLLASGIRLIEVPGPRGVKVPMADALCSTFRGPDNVSISVSPRALSDLWLRHRHPQLDQHQVEGTEGQPFHPSHLYWLVEDEGVIIRGFHIYPIVVRPPRSGVSFSGTIDDDLVANLAVEEDERYLAKDSRQLFCCELSPPEYNVAAVTERGNSDAVVDFYLSYARANVENLHHEMIVTAQTNIGSIWAERRRVSEQYVLDLLTCYASRLEHFRQLELSMPEISDAYAELTDAAAISEADKYMAAGKQVPNKLEERCLHIHLRSYPNRSDLLQRLCEVLVSQGRHVPLVLEKRSLDSLLVLFPDRDDLVQRLDVVKRDIAKLAQSQPSETFASKRSEDARGFGTNMRIRMRRLFLK